MCLNCIMRSLKKVDKKLLLNHVRHAGSHNKIQEEKDMWQQRQREKRRDTGKERERDDWSVRASAMADSTLMSHRLVSDTYEPRRVSSTPSPSPSPPSRSYYTHDLHHPSRQEERKKKATPSNYWTRELTKAEEADPFRWGHAGYKEQHPEEFISTDESSDVEDDKLEKPKKKKKKKRRKKEKSKDIEAHSKHKRREGKMKKKRRQILAEDSHSDADSSSSAEDMKTTSKRKHKYGRRRKRQRIETEDRLTDTNSLSLPMDTERNSKHKRSDRRKRKRRRKSAEDYSSDTDDSSSSLEDSEEIKRRKRKKLKKREKKKLIK